MRPIAVNGTASDQERWNEDRGEQDDDSPTPGQISFPPTEMGGAQSFLATHRRHEPSRKRDPRGDLAAFSDSPHPAAGLGILRQHPSSEYEQERKRKRQ